MMLSTLSRLRQSQVITKPHVGCHGYLYTTGSSSLIRLIWGRKRLAKTLAAHTVMLRNQFFPVQLYFERFCYWDELHAVFH